jgi:hypothetical protein
MAWRYPRTTVMLCAWIKSTVTPNGMIVPSWRWDNSPTTGLAAPTPQGYKDIRVHLVYAIKHNGRRKARLVADGHLTHLPLDSVYSGVVSLKGLRSMIFIAEMNQLPIWSTDIGNTYLKA